MAFVAWFFLGVRAVSSIFFQEMEDTAAGSRTSERCVCVCVCVCFRAAAALREES